MDGGAAVAVRSAEQALAAAPNSPVARLLLARARLATGNVDSAEAEMKKLLAESKLPIISADTMGEAAERVVAAAAKA